MIPVQHIHPMLVHFPIVFFLCLAAIDTVASLGSRPFTGRNSLGNVSTGLALLSGLFALAAVAFGGMALGVAEANGFRSDVAEIHESLGTATAIGFAVWALVRMLLWYRNAQISGGRAALVTLVELAGAGAVIATAYYGGQLVYDLGVNVAKVASAV